tara:strand:- start:238 stop:1209 length:972 start_codon:yes stop_codon:yes gene_type:complete
MSLPSILVTGASGNLGKKIILKLHILNKFRIVGIDIKSDKDLENKIELINIDISKLEQLNKNFKNIDLICHCASLIDSAAYSEIDYKNTNILGTENIYSVAQKENIKKIVLTSSTSVMEMDKKNEKWPIYEKYVGEPNNIYGKSKKEQELIAKKYSENYNIQTICLRPCSFFNLDNPELGFRLTGSHAILDDIVDAHISAIDTLLYNKSKNIKKFEPIFVTNKLPYKDGDQKLLGKKGEMKKIVSKYWPNKCEFIFELGYKKTVFSGVYDLDKAKNILNWEPKYNYDEWFNDCKKQDLNFEEEKKQHQQKKSILNKILKIFKK